MHPQHSQCSSASTAWLQACSHNCCRLLQSISLQPRLPQYPTRQSSPAVQMWLALCGAQPVCTESWNRQCLTVCTPAHSPCLRVAWVSSRREIRLSRGTQALPREPGLCHIHAAGCYNQSPCSRCSCSSPGSRRLLCRCGWHCVAPRPARSRSRCGAPAA